MTLATVVPGVVLVPEVPLSPRVGLVVDRPTFVSAEVISELSGTAPVLPVVSSMMIVVGGGTVPETRFHWVTSCIRTGPTFPTAAVLNPACRAAANRVSSFK